MTLTLELAEEQVAALKAKAAAEGLSLERWLGKIANQDAEPRRKSALRHRPKRSMKIVAR